MRLLLDTCMVVFMIEEQDCISREVSAMLDNYENQLHVSMETIRELIIAYRRKGLFSERWKSPDDIITYIHTYAKLEINEAQGHYDPSDHIIIAHAITEKMTLISSDRKFEFYRGQGLDFVWNRR